MLSDSILSKTHEDKLCKEDTIKVPCFPDAKFGDFYYYAIQLVNKIPD